MKALSLALNNGKITYLQVFVVYHTLGLVTNKNTMFVNFYYFQDNASVAKMQIRVLHLTFLII